MSIRQYLRLGVLSVPALFLTATLALRPAGATYLWLLVGVPALFPRFADTRVITSGWDCARRGIDALKTNPCDPFNRPMNYPRLWLLPGHLGLDATSTNYLAIGLVIAFLVSVFFLLGPISPRQALYYLLVLTSFPVMLLIERGNNDLLIFALLVTIAAALARLDRLGWAIAAMLVLLAVALKLYPIASVHALFLRLRRWPQQLLTVALVVVAAGYAYVIGQDLVLIESSTPRPTFLGYGLNVPIQQMLGDAHVLLRTQIPPWVELSANGIVLLMLAGLALPLARRMPRGRLDMQTQRGRFVGLLFSLGASVYVVTFVIGNNWDYRLAFLLLVMPQLFVWTESPRLVNEARVMLVAILASLWLAGVTHYPLFQVNQLGFYALFVYLTAVLAIVSIEHLGIATEQPGRLEGAPAR